MTKFIKDDELHKIIQFEEQYELSDPKQWSYLDSVEGREAVSCAFSKIDFKDKLQNMYLETDEDKYNYWLNFPTGISIDELNEEGIYVDPDGYRKDINEYEIGGGLHIYRVDGFEVTDFAKLCVMLSAITNICSEFKHSPCIPGADFFDIFGCYYLSERKIGKKPEITEYDTSYYGEYLAEWYFDFLTHLGYSKKNLMIIYRWKQNKSAFQILKLLNRIVLLIVCTQKKFIRLNVKFI